MVDFLFKFIYKGGGIIFFVYFVIGELMIDCEMVSFVWIFGKLDLLEGVNFWVWNVVVDGSLFFVLFMFIFVYVVGYYD